jgi:TM2 domain-containing membrane protein YozV
MTKGVLVVTSTGIVVDVVSITAAAVWITDVDSMTGVVSRTGVGVTVAAVVVSAIGIDAVVVALVSVLVVNGLLTTMAGSVVSGTLLLVLTNTVVS